MQLARNQLDIAGRSQGLNLISSLVDVELGIRRDTVFDNAAKAPARRAGDYELGNQVADFRLGIGPARRDECAVAGRRQPL